MTSVALLKMEMRWSLFDPPLCVKHFRLKNSIFRQNCITQVGSLHSFIGLIIFNTLMGLQIDYSQYRSSSTKEKKGMSYFYV